MCRRILLVHKTIHNKTSSYLKDKLPANHRPYLFSVNISNTFRKIRCRSLRYLNSFFPNAIASWKTIIKHCVPSFDDHKTCIFRSNGTASDFCHLSTHCNLRPIAEYAHFYFITFLIQLKDQA